MAFRVTQACPLKGDALIQDEAAQLADLGWRNALAQVEQLRQQLWRTATSSGVAICPDPAAVFRAFDAPFGEVKVVIVGQDPYPNPDVAIGLAFAVPRSTSPLPPTLRNILRELHDDCCPAALTSDALPNPELTGWMRQGVMLLNTSLTCEAFGSLSHAQIGWQEFTAAALQALARRGTPLVAVLWGRHAQSMKTHLAGVACIESAHPSPLSASRGFFGSRPFSAVNAQLVSQGVEPIDWCKTG